MLNQVELSHTEQERHEDNQRRFIEIEKKIDANTKLTERSVADAAEFLEIFRAVRGGFKVLGWLGNLAKWAAGLSAALLGAYYAIKNGSSS